MSAKRLDTRRSRSATFLLDENIYSETLAVRLRETPGWTVEIHPDHLERSTPDDVVARFCGDKGWGLITSDEMRFTPSTKIEIVRGNVRVFKVCGRKVTHYTEIVAALVIAQPRMLEIMHKNRLAISAHIHANGDVRIATTFNDVIPPNLTPSQLRTFRKFGRA